MVWCTELTVHHCFTSFRLSHENHAIRHNWCWFLTEITSHSVQADGVSLCLLGVRTWQPSELAAKLPWVSSATQPPALHIWQKSSPRDMMLAPAQGLLQLGGCAGDLEAHRLDIPYPSFPSAIHLAVSSRMAELYTCKFLLVTLGAQAQVFTPMNPFHCVLV